MAAEEKIDWQFIVDTLQNDKCVLFIGPEVLKEANSNNTHWDDLIDYLGGEENLDITKNYGQDSLFLFSSRAKKTKTYYKIKSFYQQDFPVANAVFEKIAQIPFSLIVSVNPDHLISKTFSDLGLNHSKSFYWMNKPAKDVPTPKPNNPLIYNMLGSVDYQESMVLTHNDLFSYFESIFNGASLPEIIKLKITKADNFIFLGVPFDRWYMQLLLRILYIHNDDDFVRYAANQEVEEEVKSFCLEQFRIEFVPDRIADFVDCLLENCKERQVLRELSHEKVSPIDGLLKLMEEDYVVEVFEQLQHQINIDPYFQNTMGDEFILLRGRFNRLRRRQMEGVIPYADATIAENEIRSQLLKFIQQYNVIS